MVAAPAAQDAIARARRLPRLRVGLHLVLVEGRPILPPQRRARSRRRDRPVPQRHGRVSDSRYSRVLRSAGRSRRRSRRSSKPIARPGLRSITSMRTSIFICIRRSADQVIAIGRRYGLRALRVPRRAGSRAGPGGALGATMAGPCRPPRGRRCSAAVPGGAGLQACGRRVRPGLVRRDDATALAGLLRHLPEGRTEIYMHPATSRRFRGTCARLPLRRRACRAHRTGRDRGGAPPRCRRSAAMPISDRARTRLRSAHVAGLPEPRDRIRDRLAIGPRDIAELAPRLGVVEEHVMARHAQAVAGRERLLAGQPRP